MPNIYPGQLVNLGKKAQGPQDRPMMAQYGPNMAPGWPRDGPTSGLFPQDALPCQITGDHLEFLMLLVPRTGASRHSAA